MRNLFRLTANSKLIFILLTVSLVGMAIVGYLGWRTSQEALTDAIFNQLTTVRAAKASRIEAYFADLRNQIEALAEGEMVATAMVRFNRTFQEADQEFISDEVEAAIESHYTRVYLPELAKHIATQPQFETYRPRSQAANYLQYHYVAANPAEPGEQAQLDDAGDGSPYSRWHAYYHSRLHNLMVRFGYGDLYLINHKTGDVVYTVQKRPEFGTNLALGPYRESPLSRIVSAVQNNPDRGTIQIVDFEPYRPTTGAPAAFLAAPIYNGPHMVGILAIQLPTDQIDALTTGNQNWQDEGLGETGETYLVGADFRMRSIARPLITDRAGYFATLRANGFQNQTLDLMDQFDSSILLQTVETETARMAMTGQTDTRLAQNYLGQTVLSAYQPLDIPGLSWAILTEMDQDEALQPIYHQQRDFLNALAILILVLVILALILTYLFLRPLRILVTNTAKASANTLEGTIDLPTRDEFGQLAGHINTLVEQTRTQTALVAEKEQETEQLLNNILPVSVADRRHQGETQIVDSVAQATVLAANLVGLTKLSQEKTPAEIVDIFNAIVNAFDDAGKRHGMEKQRTSSDYYISVCGLTTARLDHANRAVDFAEEMLAIITRINTRYSVMLGLQIGVNTGPVMAGVIGDEMFTYKIWGETVKIAQHLSTTADLNAVIVSKAVFDRLENVQTFVEYRSIDVEEIGTLSTWALASSVPEMTEPTVG